METARLRISEMAAVAERDELAIRARAEQYADRIRRTGERQALRETVQAAGEAAASMPTPEPVVKPESAPAAESDTMPAQPAADPANPDEGPGVVGLTRDIIKLLQGRPTSDRDR